MQPAVFTCSTIYDFQDLRSALRYWFEARGYRVLQSEFTDFPKTPDQNSYDACRTAIQHADYFAVFIGARTGGWFDEPNKISITRQEYRWAREAFLATGKPKIIAFVRQSVWDVREDRRGLKALIAEDDAIAKNLTAEQTQRLINHPSKFVSEAEAIFAFLSEIGQVDAMKSAVAGSGELPVANWIHTFSEFKHVIVAVETTFGVTTNARRMTIIANLKAELLANAAKLSNNWSVGVTALVFALASRSLRASHPSDDYNTVLPTKEWRELLFAYLMLAGCEDSLSNEFLREALQEDLFLEFDNTIHGFKPTRMHERALELHTGINRIQRPIKITAELEAAALNTKYWQPHGRPTPEHVTVPHLEYGVARTKVAAIERVLDLTGVLYLALCGQEKHINAIGDYVAWSPLTGEKSKLDTERVTLEHAAKWIQQRFP